MIILPRHCTCESNNDCIPTSEDSEFGSDTPLRVFEPEAWQRRELYPVIETEDQETASPRAADNTSPAAVMYFIGFDMNELGIENGSEDEPWRYEWPIELDGLLATLWLRFGHLNHALDKYDLAASCARLAGQMFIDLDDLSGAQQAVQLLQTLGANLGDLEYVKSMGEFQHELLSKAVARKDQRANCCV